MDRREIAEILGFFVFLMWTGMIFQMMAIIFIKGVDRQ